MDLVADGLEMTIVNHQVNKLLYFYEIRRNNTALTKVCSRSKF
jgi:Na+/serine symporter